MPPNNRHNDLQLIFFTFCLLFFTVTVFTENIAEAAPTRPGAKNPLAKPSRRVLFADDEVMALVPNDLPGGGFGIAASGYGFDQSLNFSPINANTNPFPLESPQIFAGSGRILSEARDQVVFARRNGLKASIFIMPTGAKKQIRSANLPGFAAPPVGSTDFMDIAVGDLDSIPDSKGFNHDEVVACHATSGNETNQQKIMVSVLNYTDKAANAPLLTKTRSSTYIDTSNFQANNPGGKIHPIESVLACAVGDFNGDGTNEIALAHLQNYNTLWVSIFRYKKNKAGNWVLSEVNKSSTTLDGHALGTLDLVAADFNGDGKDDLTTTTILHKFYPGHGWFYNVPAHFFNIGDKFFPENTGHYAHGFTSPSATSTPFKVRAAAVMTVFDPARGYDFSRRQLVVVHNEYRPIGNRSTTSLNLFAINPNDDLTDIDIYERSISLADSSEFSLATGNFRGFIEGGNPVGSVVVGYRVRNELEGYFLMTVEFFTGDGLPSVKSAKLIGSDSNNPLARSAIVNYDHNGDSVYLGAPVHITLNDLVRTDFIIQEPPKHLAYLKGKIRNVSRRPDFYVELKDSQASTFSTKSLDKTDFGFGASLATSSETSISGEKNIGIAKVGGKATVTSEFKASYDYDEHRDSYNSSYAERRLTFTGQTNNDDYLVAQIQLFDIWRYRAYGVKTPKQNGKKTKAFYEIILPGPRIEARGGGLTFDWYQPLHENGNILSYPQFTNLSSRPSDLGSFNLPPDPTVLKEPLIPLQQLNYDGTSGSVQLEFSSTSGSGSSREYSHSLSASLDIGASVEASAEVAGIGGSTKRSVNASFNGNYSWGNLTNNDNTTSQSTGITLNKPFNGDITKAYPFYPSVYIAKDGTFKVTHQVGNLNGTDSWWQSNFGRKPDPALNLPRRFVQTLSGQWKANLRDSRKQMRGFFLCQPDKKSTAPCVELTRTPRDGEQVRLLARVYNYSTAKTAQDLLVRFEAVGYDAASNQEVGKRKIIGQTKIANLAPQQMKTASINWDTQGFGPKTLRGKANYRIYVVLDPNNTIRETYDTEATKTKNPGQNNEGWGSISIASAQAPQSSPFASSDSQFSALTTAANQPESFGIHALEAIDSISGLLMEGTVTAKLGEPLAIRVHVTSPEDDTRNHPMLVLAKDLLSDKKPEVIAGKTLQGIDGDQGSYVWLEWTPTQTGYVELQAMLTGQALMQAGQANGPGLLTVQVVE